MALANGAISALTCGLGFWRVRCIIWVIWKQLPDREGIAVAKQTSGAIKYEVRSERPMEYSPEPLPVLTIETVRTDRKTAEEDVEDLKLFGIKAWIVEVPA